MKRYTAIVLIITMLALIFTACSKKIDGTASVTGLDGGDVAVVTAEDGDVSRNEDGDVIVVVTDEDGKAVKDDDGNNLTEKADLQTALVYNNRIEFNDYYLEIPKGWTDNLSYQDLQIKNEKTGDSISIMRVEDTTYKEKMDSVQKMFSAIEDTYPKTELKEDSVEIDGSNQTLLYAFVPETSQGKPLYQGYVIMERKDAVYTFYISSQRDVRKDFDKIENILNSVQFK